MELSKIVWSLVTNLPVFRPLLISRCSRRFRQNPFLPWWRRLILSLEKVWLFSMQWVEKPVVLSPLDIDLKCSEKYWTLITCRCFVRCRPDWWHVPAQIGCSPFNSLLLKYITAALQVASKPKELRRQLNALNVVDWNTATRSARD